MRSLPTCLELEWDAEDGDDDVGGGKVADVQVDHSAHAPTGSWKEKLIFFKKKLYRSFWERNQYVTVDKVSLGSLIS